LASPLADTPFDDSLELEEVAALGCSLDEEEADGDEGADAPPLADMPPLADVLLSAFCS
jgi:hypothetical protein